MCNIYYNSLDQQNSNFCYRAFHCTLLKRISENSSVFVKLSSEVIARIKPVVDGEVFIVIEVVENVGTF